jgi:hypothetical protein
MPFGGLNVILLSDFHQFPPVGGQNVALYCEPVQRNTATIGKAIYLQFETVVILHEQKRITDIEWQVILDRSREGECTESDLQTIRKLIIMNPKCEVPDFKTNPWKTAILVTPRNCVWAAWNRLSLQCHCSETGNLLYICNAEDATLTEHTLTNMKQKVRVARMTIAETKKLPYQIQLAIVGMQVMVTLNVATEADLANGSCGTIKDIVLHPREELVHNDRTEDKGCMAPIPPCDDIIPAISPRIRPICWIRARFDTNISVGSNIYYHQRGRPDQSPSPTIPSQPSIRLHQS